jgi:hypothetical protein
MYRRYTIHRDGDLLVEDLDPQGKPIDPEPVPPEDRLPVEVVVMGPDGDEGRVQLIDLLELAYGMEAEGPSPGQRKVETKNALKLDVLD